MDGVVPQPRLDPRVAHEVGRVLDSVLIDVEAEQLAAAIYQDQADYLEGLTACSAAACDLSLIHI